jgi:hypothetical protein
MRVPLGLLAVPLLVIAIAGTLGTPDAVSRLIEQLAGHAPLTVRLQSLVPYIVGNRSVGEIAVTCFTLLVVKQCIDYFEKAE